MYVNTMEKMKPEESLVCAIFEQAVEDYGYLKTKKIEKYTVPGDKSKFSIVEIENFLKGKWCKKLLDLIPGDLCVTGDKILSVLQSRQWE